MPGAYLPNILGALTALLGLPGLAAWLGKLLSVLPSLFASAAIFRVGYLLASILREALIGANTHGG